MFLVPLKIPGTDGILTHVFVDVYGELVPVVKYTIHGCYGVALMQETTGNISHSHDIIMQVENGTLEDRCSLQAIVHFHDSREK